MTTLRTLGLRTNVTIQPTRPRPTAVEPGRRFRDALGEGASGLLGGIEEAVTIMPGGGALAAAVRAGRSGLAEGTSTAGTSGAPLSPQGPSDAETMLGAQSSQAMQLLEMQQQISMEQRQFQTVSNVMKARHDTAKAVIQNVR